MSEESFRQRAFWKMHILDGTPDSPGTNYVEIPHVQGDFTGDLGFPEPEETRLLNGGIIDQYTMIVPGGDENIAAGIEHSFSWLFGIKTGGTILQAMCNTLNAVITNNTWVVGAGVFTNAAGTGTQIYNAAGVLTNVPQSASSRHMRVHIEVLYTAQLAGNVSYGWRFEECHFTSRAPTIADVSTAVRSTFRRYGNTVPITALSGDVNLTPSVA